MFFNNINHDHNNIIIIFFIKIIYLPLSPSLIFWLSLFDWIIIMVITGEEDGKDYHFVTRWLKSTSWFCCYWLMIFVENVCWYFLNERSLLVLIILVYHLNLSSWFVVVFTTFMLLMLRDAKHFELVLFFPNSVLIIGHKGVSTLISGVLCEFQAFCAKYIYLYVYVCTFTHFSVLIFLRQTVTQRHKQQKLSG